MSMTHSDRRERRRRIAKYVEQGHDLQEAVRAFRVSEELVRSACREFGVVDKGPHTPQTHVKRRERRRRIAEFVAQGHSIPEAARAFGVSWSLADIACREFGAVAQKPNRPQASVQSAKSNHRAIDATKRESNQPAAFPSPRSRERRRRIAEFVAQGHSRKEAASAFGVSLDHVLKSCQEFGVPVKELTHFRSSTYGVIAALFNESLTLEEIGQTFRISRQRVHQIYQKCLEVGIPIPKRRRGKAKG
jgi:transposase